MNRPTGSARVGELPPHPLPLQSSWPHSRWHITATWNTMEDQISWVLDLDWISVETMTLINIHSGGHDIPIPGFIYKGDVKSLKPGKIFRNLKVSRVTLAMLGEILMFFLRTKKHVYSKLMHSNDMVIKMFLKSFLFQRSF